MKVLALILSAFVGLTTACEFGKKEDSAQESAPATEDEKQAQEAQEKLSSLNETPFVQFALTLLKEPKKPSFYARKIILRDKDRKATTEGSKVVYATLDFECTEYNKCTDYDSSQFKISFFGSEVDTAQATEELQTNDVEEYVETVETREPAGTPTLTAEDLQLSLFLTRNYDGKTDISLSENEKFGSAGSFSITVPIARLFEAVENPAVGANLTDSGPSLNIGFQYGDDSDTSTVTGANAQNKRDNKGGCTKKEDCPEGKVCTPRGECNDCWDSKDCPEGQLCTGSDECRVAECSWDVKCPKGKYCASGVCKDGCSSTSDCPSGQVCDDHKCVEGECANGGDCDCFQKCENKKCVAAGCNWFRDGNKCKGDCPEGETCERNNECKSGECQDQTHCPSGTYCKDGKCLDGCDSPSDCPHGNYCDTKTNECKPGCWSDTACPTCNTCKDNQCVKINNGVCPKGCDTPGMWIDSCANGKRGFCCDNHICSVDGPDSCNETEPDPPLCPGNQIECNGQCCGSGFKCENNQCVEITTDDGGGGQDCSPGLVYCGLDPSKAYTDCSACGTGLCIACVTAPEL